MDIGEVWSVLGIEETKDQDSIIAAYRAKVVSVNPEDDPEGFKRLREAFEEAMRRSQESEGETDSREAADPRFQPLVDRMVETYDDIELRIDLDVWKEIFSDPLCNDLDTADQAREEFLKLALDRFYLPHEVWKLADDTFSIMMELKNLKEVFPPDFMDYIAFHIQNEDFFEYSYLMPRESFKEIIREADVTIPELHKRECDYKLAEYLCHYDNYIREAAVVIQPVEDINAVRKSENPELIPANAEPDALNKLYGSVRMFLTAEIWHPMEYTGMMRLLDDEGRYEDAHAMARAILNTRLGEFMDIYGRTSACYVIVNHALINSINPEIEPERKNHPLITDEDMKVIEETLEQVLAERERFNLGLRAKIMLLCLKGEYEDANEVLLKLFEVDNQNSDASILLPYINNKLVDFYADRVAAEPDNMRHKIDKCWSLFRCDRKEEAIEELEALSYIDKDDELYIDYCNLIGRCYSRIDDFEKAEPFLAEWLRRLTLIEERYNKDPDSVNEEDAKRLKRIGYSYYLLGAANFRLDKLEDAEKYIKLSVEKEKDEVDIPYYLETLGLLYHQRADYAAAMEVWNHMLELNKYNASTYIHRQETAYKMRDAQLVIDDYNVLIQHAPQYPKSYFFAAKIFYIYDHAADLEDVFKRAEENGIHSSALQLVKADYYKEQSNLEAAEKIYKELDDELAKGEGDLEDCDALRDYYLSAGHFKNIKDESPEEYYKAGLAKYPQDAPLNYAYGLYLYEHDKYAEAETFFKKTLEYNPRHHAANNKLSRIYSDIYDDSEDPAKYDLAVVHATKQLDNNDDDYYYVERALLYSSGYEFEKVIADCDKAIEKDETNYYAFNARGYAYMMLKDYRKAEENFMTGIRLMKDVDVNDKLSNLYHNLARCYEMQEKFNESITVLRNIIITFGENINVHSRIAKSLRRAGRYDEALNECETMLKYHQEKFQETGNEWYLEYIMEDYDQMFTVCLSKGDYRKAQFIKDERIYKMVNDNRLLTGKRAIKNNNVSCSILQKVASIEYYDARDYAKAYKIYDKAYSLLLPVSSVFDNNMRSTLIDICVEMGGAAWRLGKYGVSMRLAEAAILTIKKMSGSVENYLNYHRNSTYRKKDYALLLAFAGKWDEAVAMAKSAVDAPRCAFCRHGSCYEAYLSLAKICEFKNDKAGALEYYRKANEIGRDDSEVISAMIAFTGGRN